MQSQDGHGLDFVRMPTCWREDHDPIRRFFVAGTPVTFPAADLHGAYEGRLGGILWAAATDTGEKIAETRLDTAPVWDGIAVAGGRLYVSLEDGAVVCLGNE